MKDCPFCQIVREEAPATIISRLRGILIIEPLRPVTPGHVLVIPEEHVRDFTEDAYVASYVMWGASRYAREHGGHWNVITSAGRSATQTVMHMHLHLVPRRRGDGLRLPWSTT